MLSYLCHDRIQLFVYKTALIKETSFSIYFLSVGIASSTKNVKKRRDKDERKIELEKWEKKRSFSFSRQNSSNGNGGNVSVVTISPIVNTSLVIDTHSPIWKRYNALRAYQRFYVGALFYIYNCISIQRWSYTIYTLSMSIDRACNCCQQNDIT